MPLQRLLVAIDSAEKDHRALALGIALGRQFGSELLICTAIDHAALIGEASTPDAVYPSVTLVLEEYDAAANALLHEASARAAAAGVPATTKLLDGRPAAALVARAKGSAVDAIVMATRGRTGVERAFLGSTAEGVLKLTELPTFLLHFSEGSATAPPAETAPIRRIVVAVDDSDPADAAIAFATELAEAAAASLLYCNVVETEDLLRKASGYGYDPRPMLAEMQTAANALLRSKSEPARERALDVASVVAEGKLPDAILETAAARGADLIALGTHGRRGIKRLFLGSVAESVLRRSVVPVVVVHAPKPAR